MNGGVKVTRNDTPNIPAITNEFIFTIHQYLPAKVGIGEQAEANKTFISLASITNSAVRRTAIIPRTARALWRNQLVSRIPLFYPKPCRAGILAFVFHDILP